MESRAKLFGHPIHPMLIPFPIGLLGTSLAFDVIYLITGNGFWAEMAYWLIAAGLIGGLIAAPFGWIDWFALPRNTRAANVGLLHGIGNVVVLGIFAISWLLRGAGAGPADVGIMPIILSVIGVALLMVTGWLGGELVDRLRVGVDDGAHLNAPSALSGRPAGEDRERGEAAIDAHARRGRREPG